MSLTSAPMPPDGSVGPGVADLTIMTIGGRNPYVISASEIGPKWEVNLSATLTVDVPLSELTSQFQLSALEGMWVSWYGNALGSFAGKIERVAADVANRTAQLSCVDHSGNLGNRRVPGKTNLVIQGCAGGLADVLCKFAEMDDTLWLNRVDYEDAGVLLSIQPTGQDLLQLLRQNAQNSDQEFRVDENRNLVWRKRLGSDLTNSVQLNEGIEIASFTPSWDVSNLVNDLTVLPSQSVYTARYARRVQDDASITAIGRRQDRYTTSRAIRPSAVRSIGQKLVTRSAALGRTIALDVVNVNDCFASFREGDTIRLVLPSINLATDARVLQRSYTLSDGVLLLTTEMI